MFGSPRTTASRSPREKLERKNSEYKSVDSSDATLPLEKLELLLKKLKIQFYFCFFGIILTIFIYSALRFKSPCCELPFKESSCMSRNVLPPTNHSTLAEEVDGFLAASRKKIANLRDIIKMPLITDRQKTLEASKNELWHLIQQHSSNLAAFGVIKREEERRKQFAEAMGNGYTVFALFAVFGAFYIVIMAAQLHNAATSKLSDLNRVEELSAEEGDNYQASMIL
ncbi:hypothetical protein Ddc_10209 [Ditylenchus destructor]|nr:hypothetical protein Ddc_10209 [Ditylenchus destructor]